MHITNLIHKTLLTMKQLRFFVFLTLLIGMVIPRNVHAQNTLNTQGHYKGVIQVKFTPNQTQKLRQMLNLSADAAGKMKSSSTNRVVKTGFQEMDRNNQQFRVHTMKRVFRPAGKFEQKHIAAGLHLWYELKFDPEIDVQSVLKAYQNLDAIEVATPLSKVDIPNMEEAYMSETETQKKETTSPVTAGFPNDPVYTKQWHYHNTGQSNGTPGIDIDLEKAWDIEKGDSRVIVAVTDHSIDPNHEDLKGNMWVNPGEIAGNNIDDDNNGFVDDVHGYDFVLNTGTLAGTDRHGIHVAGTIAAETNNGIGVAGIAGGTGNDDGVRIMSIGVFANRGSGGFAEGYVYAADNGAVISQNSWNRSSGIDDTVTAQRAAIDYFIANAGGTDKAMNGGVVIFSMGNDRSERETHHAIYEPVIAVCATDRNDERASYSNIGNWASVSAPGGDAMYQYEPEGIWSTMPNNTYSYLRGTSMAAPHVSGLAALLVSNNYGTITPLQVREIIEGTTEFIDFKNAGIEGKLGAGRINAYEALRVAENMHIPISVKAQNITTTSATISWKSLASDTNFEAVFKKSSDTSWDSATTSGTTTNLSNLEEGQWYDVKVRSVQDGVTSPYSAVFTFITKVASLPTPSGLTVSNVEETTADLTWIRPDNVLAYDIQHRVVGTNDWKTFRVHIGNKAQLTELYPKTQYEVQIKAIHGAVSSAFSTSQVFLTTYTQCGEIEPWQPIEYPVNGTKVAYKGKIWANTWWAGPNDVPGTGPWRGQGNCPTGNENQPPTVSITQPTDQQVFEQETLTAITLSANASDPDGTISSIQFEANGTTLAPGNNLSWLPPTFGAYTIKVTATDDKGATATSQITITVREKTNNQPPTVSITTPTNGQVFEQETLTAITLSANASDPDGTIDTIQFEANGTTLTQGNNINWTPIAFGDYTIKVTATDDMAATTTDQINITIQQKTDNQPPTVSITQPTNQQVFEQEVLTAITLSANASDPDGTIDTIQFEADGTTLTQGNNLNWLPPAFGDYTIKVTVTDNKGATATSQVTITVKKTTTGGDCNGIAPWDPSTIYPSDGGVQVSYNGSIYENKWWTQNNIPGTGGSWGPWELIGPCATTITSDSFITVFPTPAKETLQIVLNNTQKNNRIKITLYPISGKGMQMLLNKKMIIGTHHITHTVSSLPKGIYILKTENGNQIETKKIVIE